MWVLFLLVALTLAVVVALPFVMPAHPSPLTKRALGFLNGTPIDVELQQLTGFPGQWLQPGPARDFDAMAAEAAAAGVPFTVNTSFRDNDFQRRLYAMWLAGTGNRAARPGFSTHQLGLSVDLSTGGQGRQSTVYRWLAENAARFNFANDVSDEPWHWTWKGSTP